MEFQTEAGRFAAADGTAYGNAGETGTYALAAAVNGLAARGVSCTGVEGQIQIPLEAEFSKAYSMEKILCKACRKRGIEWVETKIRRNPFLKVPAVTVSALGHDLGEPVLQGGIRPAEGSTAVQTEKGESMAAGHEIVLVKWIGMEGMLRIAGEKEEELRRRFAPVFVRQIQSYRKDLFAGKELEIARNAGVSEVRQITEGGILAALWELAKESGGGLDLDMKRMSILQETIEVCEQYRVNPYQLTSAGSFLMVTKEGKKLTDALRRNHIQASIIGRMTAGNDKIIHNGGDVRYLDRPAPDELYKILL